jgi:hypothetical protein
MPSTKHTSSCLAKAGDAEPIFVLRAQDQLAPIVVRKWGQLAHQAGVSRDKVQGAYALADEMEAWQAEHGAKRPD